MIDLFLFMVIGLEFVLVAIISERYYRGYYK